MDAAAEDRPHQDPEHPGEVPELRRQHRADQRSRPSDGRKMMPEDHPARGAHVVPAVGPHVRRRRPLGVDREHLCHEPGGMEAVADREGAKGRDDHPEGVHRLAPAPGQHRDAARAQGGDAAPTEQAQRTEG